MIGTCYTHSNVVNSGVTEPNLTKFLLHVEKLLPIKLLKSELRYCTRLRNASAPNEGASIGNLWPSRGKKFTL